MSILAKIAARWMPAATALPALSSTRVESTTDIVAFSADDCPIRVTLPVNVWPADPDEVPGWRIEQEKTASLYGYRLPSARTRREFDALVALTEAREEQRSMKALKPEMTPEEAAAEFLTMLRRSERTGDYTATEIYAAYIDHCTGEARVPCSEKPLKRALERLQGVWVCQQDTKRNGRRYRPTIWTIAALEEAIVEPMRMAA